MTSEEKALLAAFVRRCPMRNDLYLPRSLERQMSESMLAFVALHGRLNGPRDVSGEAYFAQRYYMNEDALVSAGVKVEHRRYY